MRLQKVSLSYRISIHAPTGGATDQYIDACALTEISIHAPTGGATAGDQSVPSMTLISIHAPTGGATPPMLKLIQNLYKISIHAPTGGATVNILEDMLNKIFQSTLPRGERRL